MIRARVLFGLLLTSAAVLVSCGKDDQDDDFAPIVGVWQGSSIDYDFTPAGVGIGFGDTEDDFDGIVEFKDDGTVIYTDDGDESTGTYTVTGDKLATTVEFSSDFPISAGTFTIKKLTNAELRLFFEDDGEFDVPGIGMVEGKLEATIFFNRD